MSKQVPSCYNSAWGPAGTDNGSRDHHPLTQTTAPPLPGATHSGLNAHTLDSSQVALQPDMGCLGQVSWRARQALTKEVLNGRLVVCNLWPRSMSGISVSTLRSFYSTFSRLVLQGR